MDFYEPNLKSLSVSHRQLAELIFSAEPAESCAVESGLNPTMRIAGNLVHSARNPMREAERIVRSVVDRKQTTLLILFGFGLGYHVEAALRLFPHLHCVVFEVDPGLLNAAFKSRDLREVLESERLSLSAGATPDALTPFITSAGREHIAVVRLRCVYTHYETEYRAADRHVEHILQRRDVNHNTLVRFGRRWVRNLAENLPTITRARPVAQLEGRFKGIPALLLAGGPSLDEVLPVLPDIRRRAVIIAVDTSLQAALRFGVDPDYTVVVDPQYWNTRHLDAARESCTEIISESSTHPRAFKVLRGKVRMASSLFPLGTYIEGERGRFGKLGAGGSVSTTAWDFARFLGCSAIYCAGLDLGFPGRNTHFRGSFFESRALTFCDRRFPVETMAFDYLHSGYTEYVPSNSGGYVLSDRRMNIYRWWFENQVRNNPQSATKTLSRDGVAIPGILPVDIGELLTRAEVRPEIDAVRSVTGCSNEGSAHSPIDEQTVVSRVRNLIEALSELEDRAVEALSAVNAAETARAAADKRTLNEALGQLEACDDGIRAHKHRDIAGFLIQETTERVKTHSAGDALEASRVLYEGLRESCSYHRITLGNALLKLHERSADTLR